MTPAILKLKLQEAIRGVVADHSNYSSDLRNFTRTYKLPLEFVVSMLHFMDGAPLAKELHRAGINATPSAFVQQRHKISSSAFRSVMRTFNAVCHDNALYRAKWRLLALDGTMIALPFNDRAESFLRVENHPRGGYNALHVTPLYDLLNKTYYDTVVQPQSKMDEIGALNTMIYARKFREPTIVVMDRGLESQNSIAHMRNIPNLDFVLRLRQDRSALREVGKLPMQELDVDLSYYITTSQSNEAKANGWVLMQVPKRGERTYSPKTRRARWDFGHIDPYHMTFRLVRFQLDSGEYETLATSLPRSQFSIEDLKELYHMRWGIETSFRMLKYCVGLINLHGKSDEFATQEVYAALTMFNFCSRISNQAVIRQKQENIYEYRVNLTMAIYLCKEFFRNPDGDPEKLMRDIAKHTEPVRPGRNDKRNIKAKGFVGFTYRVAA